MDLKKIFVANMRKFRRRERISQMKLADMCDTAASYIGEIEIGKKFPSINMIERIAAALKVDVYRLFMDESGKPPYDEGVEARDFILRTMPNRVKQEVVANLLAIISDGINDTLYPAEEKKTDAP
jgi:transcriptional regulator with XRE-family HTH domain